MEHLKTLLTEQNLSVENLEQKVISFGFDPTSLTEDQAQIIANELATATSKLVKKNSGKGKMASRKGRTKPVDFKTAIIHAAGESETEIQDLETQLRVHKQKWVETRASAIADEIRSAPTEVINALAETLTGEVADRETFRQLGDEFGSILFPLESPDAA